MNKYEIRVNNKHCGYIWAVDEFDAIWRASRRFSIPPTSIKVYAVLDDAANY